MIAIMIMYALLATTFIVGKISMNYAPPLLLVGIRLLLAGPIFFAVHYWYERKIGIHRKDWLLYAQLIIFLAYVPFAAEYCALQYTSAAKTALIYNLTPFASALLALAFLGDSLTIRQGIGLCIGFFGSLPIMFYHSHHEPYFLNTILSWPDMLLLCAVFTGAYGWIVVKKARWLGYSLALINGIAMTGGGLIMLVHSFIQEGTSHLYSQPEIQSAIGFMQYNSLTLAAATVIYLLVVSNLICYSLYTWLLDYYSVTLLSFLGLTTPIFTACFCAVLFEEQLTWHFTLTFILITLGLALFYLDESRRKKRELPDQPNRESFRG